MTVKFDGVYTALATPFSKGEIDWASLNKLTRWQLDGGVAGIVVSGTTGESPTLSMDEKKKIFEFVKSEAAGSIKLVIGTGSNSTSETLSATKLAKQWGADGALVVVPYYNKPSQAGLFQHFSLIANEGGLPVILYNVPGRTVAKLELTTIQELSKVKGIVAIKEATGDIEFGKAIATSTDLLVSSGDDGTAMKLAGVGAKGIISVISHLIPKEFSDLLGKAVRGESTAASDEFAKKYGELNDALYVEANPIPVKYALYKMGIIATPDLRLPMTALDQKHRGKLDSLLSKAGLV